MTDTKQEVLAEPGIIPEFADDTTIEAIRARFINAARSIMLEYKLVRADYCWDVTALELYLYRSGIWPDESTHGFRFSTSEQLERGTWYLHRDGKLAPKRLGIDITAGSRDPEIHAGFLIAAIGENDGSGHAVKAVLRGHSNNGNWNYSEEEKKLLTEDIHKRSIHAAHPNLRLVRRSVAREVSLWIGPRKNLGPKISERYKAACLRIATWQTSKVMKPLNEQMCGSQACGVR
jgi:hypothetical protein